MSSPATVVDQHPISSNDAPSEDNSERNFKMYVIKDY